MFPAGMLIIFQHGIILGRLLFPLVIIPNTVIQGVPSLSIVGENGALEHRLVTTRNTPN